MQITKSDYQRLSAFKSLMKENDFEFKEGNVQKLINLRVEDGEAMFDTAFEITFDTFHVDVPFIVSLTLLLSILDIHFSKKKEPEVFLELKDDKCVIINKTNRMTTNIAWKNKKRITEDVKVLEEASKLLNDGYIYQMYNDGEKPHPYIDVDISNEVMKDTLAIITKIGGAKKIAFILKDNVLKLVAKTSTYKNVDNDMQDVILAEGLNVNVDLAFEVNFKDIAHSFVNNYDYFRLYYDPECEESSSMIAFLSENINYYIEGQLISGEYGE